MLRTDLRGDTLFVEQSRFAFSTSAYSLAFAATRAETHLRCKGFSGVEILGDKPHAWMDTLTAGYQDRVVKQLDKLGLFVSNINANCTQGFWSDAPPERFFEPSLIARSREYREWRIAYTKKALRFGKALNARNVSVTSGRKRSPVCRPKKRGSFSLKVFNAWRKTRRKSEQRFFVAVRAGALLIESGDEMAALIAEVDSSYFGANLTPGQLGNPRRKSRRHNPEIEGQNLQRRFGQRHSRAKKLCSASRRRRRGFQSAL